MNDASTQTEYTWVNTLCPRKYTPSTQVSPVQEHSYQWTLWFDGGSRSNPGLAGCGAICRDTHTHTFIFSHTYFVGFRSSNNISEWQGLLQGLSKLMIHCREHSIPTNRIQLVIKGDSNLVIQQLLGKWKVRKEEFKLYRDTCIHTLNAFKEWNAFHIYRNENKEADALANQAMDKIC